MSVRTAAAGSNATPDVQAILVSEDEGAKLLGISKPVFRRWVAKGLIRPVKLPGNLNRKLYRRSDVEVFAASLPARPHHDVPQQES